MSRRARSRRVRLHAGGRLSGELRNVVLFVFVIVAALALHFHFYAYPSLVRLLVDESERDAVRAANIVRVIARMQDSEGGLGGASTARELDAAREALGVLKLKVFDRDGRVTFSTDPAETGRVNANAYFREIVAAGDIYTNRLSRDDATLEGERYVRDLVEVYIPLMEQGRFNGAFEIYYDITEQRRSFDRRVRAMGLDLAGVLAVLLAIFAVIGVRSYTAALHTEREHSARLRDEIERRLAIEEELRESHGHFRHMAHHDALTGLPNRTLFLDRFEHALANARRYKTRIGLLFIDLDRFKAINDTWGHEAGDRILIAAAAVLQKSIRESDTAARIAGDEFAVLIEHAEEKIVDILVARLACEFASGLDFGAGDVSTSASIGISLYPDDGEDVETLLRHADVAMYRAKADRRGSWQYFARAAVAGPSPG